MYEPCVTDYNISRQLTRFLQENVFFAAISRNLKKVPTMHIPTDARAAVVFDTKTDEFMLCYNPERFKLLDDDETYGLIEHELSHIAFGHLTRRREEQKFWLMGNIAQDLAINSMIVENAKKRNSTKRPLPPGGVIPGHWALHIDGSEMTPEERAANPLMKIIAELPPLKSYEWYFNKIKQECEKEGVDIENKETTYFIDFDDHSQWSEVPEEMREYLASKIRAIVEKAVKTADAQPNGWGNIPSNIREEIRNSISTRVNWRFVLKQFCGTLCSGSRTTSIRKINKRYPLIHPGLKRGRTAKLLIATDQSGSVNDEMLADLFAEIGSLAKNVDIDVLPFDCQADEADIFKWKKGTRPTVMRSKQGGTSFEAPTRVFNDPKNRGRWDGMIIATDGECSAPGQCRSKRAWVLAKGKKLMFDTSELQIFLDTDKPISF